MPEIIANLFGSLSLKEGGRILDLPSSPVARSLLAYLLYHREAPISRLKLIGLFWPNLPESKARRALSRALWQIRNNFLSDFIQANTNEVRILPDVPIWLDVEEFKNLLCSFENLKEASRLYRGDFLEDDYEDWATTIRQKFKNDYIDCLDRLIRGYKISGDYQAALESALSLSSIDPLSSHIHGEVMRLYVLNNRPQAALQHFESTRHTLQTEMGIDHTPETITLAEEISRQLKGDLTIQKTATDQPESIQTIRLPLIGRDEERSQLLSLVNSIFNAYDRSGGMVIIEGEAGVGKTHLAQEIAGDIEWRGGQVLWGSASEIEINLPFGPLADALNSGLSPLRVDQISQMIDAIWLQVLLPLLPALPEYLPALAPAPALEPEQEGIRLVEAFVQLIQAWTQFIPLVIILENLQWMDGDTLKLLPKLIRRLEKVGCVILGTQRGEEVRSFPALWEKLQVIDRAGLKGRLALDRLSADYTGELIRQALGIGAAAAPLFEKRLHQETHGNPLFVLETLRALYDEELLERDQSGVWRTPWDESTTDYAEIPLPAVVEQVIQRRLSRLQPDMIHALQVASVLGSEFRFSLMRAGCDLAPEALLASIRELVRRHFIEETTQNYRFSHDKIRQVVYQDISPEGRTELHRKIAGAIAEVCPTQRLELAHHYTRGQVWDRAVHAYLDHAEFVARRYSTEAALGALHQARQITEAHTPFPPEENHRLRFEIWESSYPLYQLQGDKACCRSAVESLAEIAQSLNDPTFQIKAQLQRASYLHEIESQDEDAYRVAEEALKLATERDDPDLQARALTILGKIRRQQNRIDEAISLVNEALDLYRQLGHEQQVTEALLLLVFITRDLGDLEAASKHAEGALAQAQAQNDPLNLGHAHNAFAWITRTQGDHQAEIKHCLAMYEQMHKIGYLYYEGVALNNLSLAYSALANYQKSIETAHQALAVFQTLDHTRGQTIQWLNLSSRYKEIGQFDQVHRVLDDGLAVAQASHFEDEEARMRMSYAELLTFAGDYDAAMEHLIRAAEIADELGYSSLRGNLAYRRGEIHLARSEFSATIQEFQAMKALYLEAGWSDYTYLAQSFEAIGHLRSGNLPQAVKCSQAAIDGLGLSVIEVCFHHYLVMTADGQPDAAYEALVAAHRLLGDRLDVAPDERARQCLLNEIPLHKDIMATWKEVDPQTVSIRLPAAEAPIGRPLHEEEWVTVAWTPIAPEDRKITKKTERRKTRLLRLMREAEAQGAAPTVEALAAALEVSNRTIKRDLAALRAEGRAIKTRGTRK